ncbi:MAG: Arc family DNA-binding protein [Dehalococcoidia bacterium]|nr:Arc family DNA-binding protein [Dehalococcoidia bacterium]
MIVVASLSVKNVSDTLLEALRERARRNHRSLQGELLAILEDAVTNGVYTTRVTYDTSRQIGEERAVDNASTSAEGMTPDELHRRVAARGLSTPSESSWMVREDRDSR